MPISLSGSVLQCRGRAAAQQVTEDGVGDGDGEQVRFYLYRVIEISSFGMSPYCNVCF